MGLLGVALGLIAGLFGGAAAADDLWQALRQGGYVILVRHAVVDNFSRSTSPDADFEGCEGQYNLTEAGLAQARWLGDYLRKQQVAVGEVLASPLCRARDTARIAFGAYRAWEELEPMPEQEGPERAQRMAAVSKVIAGYKGPGNLILVTHQPNIDALALELVEPATMVVLKPDGRGGFATVRTIPLSEMGFTPTVP
jgi:phosphohistidine phosphatase SixA